MKKTFAWAIAGILMSGCAPSPDSVCDHMIEILKKEAGEAAAGELDKGECVKDLERKKEMKGLMKYRKEASCVMDAESFQDMEKCGK